MKYLSAAFDPMPAEIVSPLASEPSNPRPAPIGQGCRVKRILLTTVCCLRSQVQVLAFRYNPKPAIPRMLWQE
jgi:hypothetical protein